MQKTSIKDRGDMSTRRDVDLPVVHLLLHLQLPHLVYLQTVSIHTPRKRLRHGQTGSRRDDAPREEIRKSGRPI